MAQVTVTTDFKDTTASGWVFGGSVGSTNPYLTANTIDTPGDGWLRLTENIGNQATYALFDSAIFSVNAQIEITMDYAFYNGSGADGITFFLVDGAVDAGSFSPGAYGGSMGYAQKTGIDGMAGGYLGFALDNWGNYSNATEGRVGGTGFVPNSVAVRGPESSNYDFIDGSGDLSVLSGGGQMDFPAYTSRPDQSGADYRSFKMTLDANNQLTVDMKFGASGDFITVFTADLSSYDRPDTFKIGFTGATGGANEIHEVRNVAVTMSPWQPDAFEWDDGGSGSSWTTSGNWVDDAVPTPDADILFGNAPLTGVNQTVTMNSNEEVRSLTFDSALNYSINGTGTLTLGDALQAGLPSINVNDYNGAQGQHHINVDLDVVEQLRINNYSFSTLCINGTVATNGNEIDVNGTGATNFNGAIVGSGDMNKNGTGIVTLNNNNTSWTGDVNVNSGMAVVTTNGALGTTAGTTTVADGGTLAFRAPTVSGSVNYTTAESVTISGQGIYRGREGQVGAIYNDGGINSFAGNITLAADSGIGSRAGVLTLSGVVSDGAGSFTLTKRGEGVVELTNGSNAWNGATVINDGVLRISGSSNALAGGFSTNGYTGGNLQLNGGVLEIGVNTTFNRSVGTGSDQVQWTGDGGFSAFGANRTVTLSGGTMTWGSGSFVPTNNALLLSSDYANAMVTFTNAINLGGASREVRVANGSATVDGTLSGNLTGTGGGLVKTGEGTLNLTGTNSYTGATEIQGGALRGNISGSSNLVLNGGVRELTGNFTGNLGTGGGQVQWSGDGGFSASGSNRTVTLNNNATTALTWGSTANFIGDGDTLILGSQSANRTLIFNNTVNLGGANRTIKVVDGSATTDARMNRVISNGSLTVVGDGNLAMRGNNTLAGTVTVKGATLTLESTGNLNSITGLTVQEGGTFSMDNTLSSDTTRLANSAAVSLAGGTIALIGRSNTTSTETAGALTLSSGANTINSTRAGTGSTRLTFGSLTRNTGATLDFGLPNTSSDVRFSTAPTLTNGILAYATVNGTDFAAHSGNNTDVVAYAGYNTGSQTGWTSTTNAAPTSDQTLTANRGANSMKLGAGIDVDAGGYTLNLTSGGLLAIGTASAITNGTLTAGGAGAGELIANIYGTGGLDVSAVIANNGANEVSLTKTGDGTLTLSGGTANTFTGDVYVNDGTLALNKSANTTAITGDIFVGDGRGTDILQLNNDEQIADSANVTLKGSEYGGATILQFNGAGGEGLIETFANLTIDGTTIIDFAGGNVCDANFLYLDDLLMSSPDSMLFIRNWIDYTDFLLVRNEANLGTVLNQIQFEGYGDGAYWAEYDTQYSRITPVPEPTTYGALMMLGGLAAYIYRRRKAVKAI
ncbi:MAG: autotransporter-associated beta strand repeat-containing protein [Cephaloticoccus sp.]|nr:autotransporter-associated beta strand repeat-containing protein [Cephaloticoccus sp.]